MQWSLLAAQESRRDRCLFTYASSQDLRAVMTVELDYEYRAAVCQLTLTNGGHAPTMPFSNLSALWLNLLNIETTPRVMSSAGGVCAKDYPPTSSYWTRRQILQYPYPAHPIEFSTPGDLSSTKDLPLILVSPDIESNAPGFIFGMEWSSAWRAEISYDAETDALVVSEGPHVEDVLLEPGESLALPRVHLVFFDGGFESGSNACRRYIRDRVTPSYGGRPVTPPVAYTIWPGLVAPYTEKDLYPQIDAAADMGVEVFILDDAWYPGDFPRGRGNWYPDPVKFPHGLEPLAEYVASKQMGFGLFFEPEMAEPGTKILREHPDFFYEPPDAEGRCLYKFSRPEACAYMIELIGGFIQRYNLRYLRWDHNTASTPFLRAVDPTSKLDFAHLSGLYHVWETLLRQYPSLMLECCCGGGNRLDLGTMKRHHTCWCNDNMFHPHIYHAMQLGGNVFLPAYYLGSSLGWPPRSGTGRRPDIARHPDADLPDLSFLSRMAGMFFLHGRIADWSPESRRRASHWIAVYKHIRHLLVADYYRLLPQPQSEADWDAGQFCQGTTEGVVFVFRWAGAAENRRLPLSSLEAGGSYVFRDQATGKDAVYSGDDLMAQGLPVNLGRDSAKLFSYRRR